MPCETRKEIKRKRARKAKLKKLRAQYAEGKNKAAIVEKLKKIAPNLSEKEFAAPLKKK